MKISVFLALALACGAAVATNVEPPMHPAPQPAPAPRVDVNVGAQAGAAASSQSSAQVTGASTATTGASTATAQGAPITIGGDTSTSRSYAIGLPPPVYAAGAAINGCTVAGQKAGALGWNFISGTKPSIHAERTCVMLTLAASAWDTCQFASASTIRRLLAEEVLGEAAKRLPPLPVAERDLTAEECATYKRPATVVEDRRPVTYINVEGSRADAEVAAPAPAPVEPPKAPARPPKGKTSTRGACAVDEVQVCLPRK